VKFEGHTLIWGHINLWCLIGSKVIRGLNIRRKILHFVSLAIYFQVNHLKSQDQTHLLLKDLIVGRKLMMGNGVFFLLIWEKVSAHRFATICLKVLKNHSCHIEKVVKRQTIQEILNNWLRMKASINIVHWLTFQACAFRGHDERLE